MIKDSLKTDALKLGICLNFSVFYYEINNSVEEAIAICERGFNEALEAVSDLEDTRFTDVVTIMQLMHDNITAWKLELEKSSK
jgi:14-3-3 protein epsilon